MPGFMGAADSWLRRVAGRAIAIAAIAVVIGAVPAQRACAAPAVTAENLTFVNAGVTLSGTLYRAHRPFAAVVIVHGSGQEKRMSEFAALLAGQGVTTLTYDKRGVGESGGVYAGPEVGTNNVDAANLRLLAGDAAAAAAALSERLAHDRTPVGLLGFSQAGWIIPIAAGASPSVRFMVLFSGPVVTAREQLRFQFLTEGTPDFWATHTEGEVRERLRTDPDRYQFDDTDPRDSLAGLSIPGSLDLRRTGRPVAGSALDRASRIDRAQRREARVPGVSGAGSQHGFRCVERAGDHRLAVDGIRRGPCHGEFRRSPAGRALRNAPRRDRAALS